MEALLFLLGLAFLCFVIWLWWYIAKQFEEVAEAKGYTDKKYFWICFWLGAIGYLLVVALPDRASTIQVPSEELPDL